MGKASIVALVAVLSLLPYAASAAARKAKPIAAMTSVKQTTAKRTTGKLNAKTVAASTGRHNNNSKATGKKGARLVTTRLVRTRSGRLTRVVVHAPPAPTFQTHPDPDRYTEIQKALADRGYFKGEPNGAWSDESTDALRRFQAGSHLPDDGKISALTLTGLGLGPRHDGSTASTVPLSAVGSTLLSSPTPSITGATVGPAASSPIPATPAAQPPKR